MRGFRFERWAPASGIVYVVLSVVGFAIAGNIGKTDEEILAHYADSGRRARDIASFLIAPLAVLFFLVFLITLWNRLRSVESEPKPLSALAFGAGITSSALFVGAVALFVGTDFAAQESEFVADPNVARVADAAGYLLLVGSLMVMSALVAATSVLALRTPVLPRWLGWAGLCVALVQLAAITFFPILVLWLWIVVVSVLLIERTPTSHALARASEAT